MGHFFSLDFLTLESIILFQNADISFSAFYFLILLSNLVNLTQHYRTTTKTPLKQSRIFLLAILNMRKRNTLITFQGKG